MQNHNNSLDIASILNAKFNANFRNNSSLGVSGENYLKFKIRASEHCQLHLSQHGYLSIILNELSINSTQNKCQTRLRQDFIVFVVWLTDVNTNPSGSVVIALFVHLTQKYLA